jgi:hypothetical protein
MVKYCIDSGLGGKNTFKVLDFFFPDQGLNYNNLRQHVNTTLGLSFTEKNKPMKEQNEITLEIMEDDKLNPNTGDLATRIKRLFKLKDIPLRKERNFSDRELANLYGDDGIIWFAEEVVGLELYDYQKEMLRTVKKNNTAAIIAGRQIGKTLLMSICALYFAMTEVCNIAIASRSLKQAQILYTAMKRFIIPKKQLEESVLRLSKECIEFKNGSTIKFFSGLTPEGILGMSRSHLFVDEFTFVGNRFFELANPVRAVGGKKLVCMGTAGYVDRTLWSWRLWFQNEDVAKLEFPSELNPEITDKFLEGQRKIYDQDTFDAMYNCRWIDQADKWFSWKLLDASTEEYDASNLMPEHGGIYNVGIDPSYSGTGDYACISVCKRYTVKRDKQEMPAFRLVYEKRFKPETMEELINEMEVVRQNYGDHINTLVVDSSDFRLLEALRNMGIYALPYEFSGEGRNNLMKALKGLLEQGRLTLPDNMDLTREFCSLKYNVTSNGKLRVVATGHDDQVVSIGMAIITDERAFIESLDSQPFVRALPFASFSRKRVSGTLSKLQNWKPKVLTF